MIHLLPLVEQMEMPPIDWLSSNIYGKTRCLQYIYTRKNNGLETTYYIRTTPELSEFSYTFPGLPTLFYKATAPLTIQSIFHWELFAALDLDTSLFVLTYSEYLLKSMAYHFNLRLEKPL